jgi:hypothetical protein
MFFWYRINEYGCADVIEDSPAASAAVNKDPPRYYGNAEGAIINGGVQACAFKREVVKLYDTAEFFRSGKYVPAGEKVILTITAQPKI